MTGPDALLAAWFADGPDSPRDVWFRSDASFDAMLRDRFGPLAASAARGGCDELAASPRGALALCLLLDQLPRNLHRGSPVAFATDAAARAIARAAVLRDGHDRALTTTERVFLYLPFEHSEVPADQDLSVALFEGMRDDPRHRGAGGVIEFAWEHRAVIRRFGRFPRRNAALGRESTAAEQHYLADPKSRF